MQGKSWAHLHNLFQNWIRSEYPNVCDLSIREIDLMWKAWLKSNEITKWALRKPEPWMEPTLWFDDYV